MKTILKREFLAYFHMPIAYVYCVVYLVLSTLFTFAFGRFIENNQASLRVFFNWQPWILLFLVPALGMRSWSEEKRTGTAELLLTLPVSPARLIAGKYLAGWGFIGLSMLMTFPMVLVVSYLGSPDLGMILCGYLGCFLLGGAILAVSVAVSAMTRDQIVCYAASFFICLLLMLTGVRTMLLMMLKAGLNEAVMALIARLSLLTAFNGFVSGVVRLPNFCLFLSVIMAALAVNFLALPGACGRRRLQFGLVLILGIVVVNVIICCFPVVVDCTADNTFTLSGASVRLLKNLPRPVQIDFYYSRNYPELTDAMMAFAERTEELLRQYDASGKNITVSLKNPETDEEEADAEAAGVLPNVGSMGDSWFCSIVVASGEKKICLNNLSPESAPALEYELSRAVIDVVTDAKPRVGVLTSMPLFGLTDMKTRRQLPPWNSMTELERQCDIVKLTPDVKEVPENLALLVVVHPQNLPLQTEYAIGQFVARGGHLIVFCDSVCKAAVASMGRINPVVPSRLKALFEAWKIDFSTSQVVADAERATPMVTARDGLQVQPTLLDLNADCLNREVPFVSRLKSVKLFCAGVFSWQDTPLEVTPVLWTSPQTVMLKNYEAQRSAADIMQNFKPEEKIRYPGILLQGEFPVDFAPEFHTEAHRPSGQSKVLLLGDADMLHDSLCAEQIPGDETGEQRIVSDNIPFLLNAVEFMAGQSELAEIRSKTGMSRPLTGIQALAEDAQSRVQGVLTEVRSKELQVTAKLKNLEVVTGEAAVAAQAERLRLLQELEQNKKELYRRQRAELKALRHEIDALEFRMILLNLVLPLLIAVWGMCQYRARR